MSDKHVLLLRTCNADMSSAHDKTFIWPRSGFVEAPDWNPDPSVECGRGLHGLLWGQGDWSLLSSADDAVWMVVSVNPQDGLTPSNNKARFKRGEVVFCGARVEAMTKILCSPEAMDHAKSQADNWAQNTTALKAASNGSGSKAASSGPGSAAASSGYGSTAASSGPGSTAASSGSGSKAASSGPGSTAASSGSGSKAASSGPGSKAASNGTGGVAATIGHGGRAKAGDNGLIIITWWDEEAERYRACVGEVGVNGVKANTWYEVHEGLLREVL